MIPIHPTVTPIIPLLTYFLNPPDPLKWRSLYLCWNPSKTVQLFVATAARQQKLALGMYLESCLLAWAGLTQQIISGYLQL